MQAIVAVPGSTSAQLRARAAPEQLGPGEVLCRTLQLGICGTDREILHSGSPLVPAGESCLILGHECLARVEACGSDVNSLQCGDLVVPVVRRPLASLDEPPYPESRPDLWPWGCYTERGIVHEHGFSQPLWLDDPRYLVPVTSRQAPYAVLAEPVAVAEKAVNEALAVQRGRLGELPADGHRAAQAAAGWGPGQTPRVLVSGLGPIAFAAVLACRCRDWPVTVYGRDAPDSPRVTLLQSFAASYHRQSTWPRWDAYSAEELQSDGFDLLLECTGSDAAMVEVAPSLRATGVMVWLGSSRQPQPRLVPLAQIMRHAIIRNWAILGSVNAAPRDFSDALQHLDQMADVVPNLITRRVTLEQCLPHYSRRDTADIKVVVEFSER